METVRWVLGVLLLLAGVGSFTDNFGQALAYIAIGGALLPPVIPFIQERFFRSRENYDDIDFEITITDDDEDKPPYSSDSVVEKDAWEGDDWVFEDAVPCEASIEIDYVDASGQKTNRAVDVEYCCFLPEGGLFKGFCHLRNANRMFRFDRVRNCVDRTTGEVISDVEAYFKALYEASPDAILKNTFSEHQDLLRALLYVGKADGQLRKEEVAIVCDLVRSLANSNDLPDDIIAKNFKYLDVPSLHGFRLIVGRISEQDESMRRLVYTTSQEIVGTQKSVHSQEAEALEYMKKRFNL